MSKSGQPLDAKRTAINWGVRVLLAVALTALAFVSLTDTLANVAVRADPATAHRLAPNDGVVTAALAQTRFAQMPQSAADSDAAQLARAALLHDPTAVEALTVLGIQAQLRNDADQAGAIFAYANRLSRRELRPQVWTIEQAVLRGDIVGALEQYDVALRTSRKAESLLFPVLASAIEQQLVRSALLDLMADRPVWGEKFINFASQGSVDVQATVKLFTEGNRVNLPVDDSNRAAVVNALAARNMVDDAWSFYQTFRQDAERSRSRDPQFKNGAVPTVFDWLPMNNGGIAASIERTARGGILYFSAPATVGGTVLRQTQLLPSGTYRLEGVGATNEQAAHAQPYWQLECRSGSRIGRVVLPNETSGDDKFSGFVTVPIGCPVQTLSLVVRPSNDISGVSGRVEQAQLVPVDRVDS